MTRVCVLAPEGKVSYPDVNVEDPHAMHELLHGYMELIPLPAPLADKGLVGLVDEEGLFKDPIMPNVYSRALGQPLVGPVIIARSEPPEFVDLTDADVLVLSEIFGW